jgi:hypothetical protein
MLSLAQVRQVALARSAPGAGTLSTALRQATETARGNRGLVRLPAATPTVLVSDIHARPEFLVRVLEHDHTFERLQGGEVNVVCLGDGLHGEGRAAERWKRAAADHEIGRVTRSAAMNQEMAEGLGTMHAVMQLTNAFPQNFYFLRGNHEDMLHGNWSKYALPQGEPKLTRDWMSERYGDETLHNYAAFEESLPLLATGAGLVASHAAPARLLDIADVEARRRQAFSALAWTHNLDWTEAPAHLRQFMDALGAAPHARWFAGHRPVEHGLYREQGALLQINSPDGYVIARVGPNGEFSPERDVLNLSAH